LIEVLTYHVKAVESNFQSDARTEAFINTRSDNEVALLDELPELSGSTNCGYMAIARVVVCGAHDEGWMDIDM
jgi:hypothetical protein